MLILFFILYFWGVGGKQGGLGGHSPPQDLKGSGGQHPPS